MFVDIECEMYRLRVGNLPLNSKIDLVNFRLHVLDCVEIGTVTDVNELLLSDFKKTLMKFLVDASIGSTSKTDECLFGLNIHRLKFLDENAEAIQLLSEFTSEQPQPKKSRPETKVEASTLTKYTKYERKTTKSQHKDIMDIEDLDVVANQNFPLCMRIAHEKLKQDHYLKNFGRMIYYPFLRQTGMPFKDVYSYLRKEHEKNMPTSSFESKYKYDIEYAFSIRGNEARSKNGYNCNAIINKSESLSDGCIGCPYKLFDTSTLVQQMEKFGLDEKFIRDTEETHRQNEITPQGMCMEYFKYTNNTNDMFFFYGPKDFFDESRKIDKKHS